MPKRFLIGLRSEAMNQVDPKAETETVTPLGHRKTVATSVPFAKDGPLRVPAEPSLLAPKSLLGSLRVGSTLRPDRYTGQEVVGSGGMGEVRRVEDADLNRAVAMKVLKSKDDLERFIAEAQITSQLEHPNLLPVHDIGVDADGNLFFTMQYVGTGTTLEDVVAKLRKGDPETHARFTFRRRVQLIQQVCHALHYAHDRGVVHRDIKPSNIMLGTHGEVYLVDWGIAKLLDGSDEPQPKSELAPAEEEGQILGTLAYMAPEQLRGEVEGVDGVTDLYALSAVLYELLSLRYYLDRIATGATLYAIINTTPLDAESYDDPINGRVPRALSRICRKGLQKERAARFQSAPELERALQLWLEGRAPIVCPGTAMQRGLSALSTAIDGSPTLLPAALLTGAGLAFAAVVALAVVAAGALG